LFYRAFGARNAPKPSILCLGGLTRNSKDYFNLARRLAGEWHVICPDYRGRGRSEYCVDWRCYEARALIDDIRQVLTALNVHRVVVIGTSLGGLLGTALGVAMPSCVAGVLLNDIGPEVNRSGLAAIIDYIKEDRPQAGWAAAVDFMRQTFPDFPAETAEDWLRIARNTYREGDDGRLHYDWDPRVVRPFIGDSAMIRNLWPMFLSLRSVPLGVLRGARSNVLSAETFGRMTDALPQVIAAEISGVGHAPSLSEQTSSEVIDALLHRVSASNH
jgi:pimeloyl-ACP methyl ester carboxylesterase